MTSPVQASATFNVPAGTPATITIPGSPQANDYVVVAIGNIFATPPGITGYTQLGHRVNSVDGITCVTLYGKKIAADTTFDVGSVTGSQGGNVWLCRGQDLTTPQDAAATTGESAGSVDGPSNTSVAANAWAFSVGTTGDTSLTPTAPSGYGNLSFRQNSGVTHTCMGAVKQLAGAGAEDPGAFGSSGATNFAAITWIMRPATGGGATVKQRRTHSNLGARMGSRQASFIQVRLPPILVPAHVR